MKPVNILLLFMSFVLTFFGGYITAIRVEASAIKLERSIYTLADMFKNNKVKPGWELCHSDPIPGYPDTVIQVCKQGRADDLK